MLNITYKIGKEYENFYDYNTETQAFIILDVLILILITLSKYCIIFYSFNKFIKDTNKTLMVILYLLIITNPVEWSFIWKCCFGIYIFYI